MLLSSDIWKSLAGVAIFLLGMNFLEQGLRQLAGRPFKLFLKKQTSYKIKAISGGAVVTGILQSSSIVNLMVLAFVGAGIIQMQNALAVILGANFGATITSWIIAIFGFSFNIEDFALPLVAVSGILMILVNKESRWYQWMKLILGFGFLFVGLNYIKTGIENLVQQVDLGTLKEQPAIIFFVAGFLITSLIQASSATVAIALSALHADAISLFSATAIVLGAEVGTSIKLIIASVKGMSVKKRVAAGNFLFNMATAVIVLIFLLPVNRFITVSLGITGNLTALVFFQSLVNFVTILLFYPLLGTVAKFLEKRFAGKDDETMFIQKISATTDNELALEALEKETRNFIFHVLSFTAGAFGRELKVPEEIHHKSFERKQDAEKYEFIKTLHGEIQGFSVRLQTSSFPDNERARLHQLISCIRNNMYAAKSIRDVLHDIEQLRNSSNDTKYSFYLATKDKASTFCNDVSELMRQQEAKGSFEKITAFYKNIQQGYAQSLQALYNEGIAGHVSYSEISTLFNFNREMYTAFKSMLFALKDFLLTAKESDYFDELPGFIR